MNRKKNLVMVLLAAFAGMVMAEEFTSCSKTDSSTVTGDSKSGAVSDTPKREANGQYRIGSKVQVYDDDGKPTDAYFTYSPGKITNLDYGNMVILNFGQSYIDAALFFRESNNNENIGLFRHCIDKSIEWVATAKQNNVRSLLKEIPFDGYDVDDSTALYGLNRQNYSRHEQVYLGFSLYIGDIFENGKEETWLLMRYLTRNDLLSGALGHIFCFREDDFARLKEMFSESYLAEIDKREAAWQKSHAEQNALFKEALIP
jgi:hypothetical protein